MAHTLPLLQLDAMLGLPRRPRWWQCVCWTARCCTLPSKCIKPAGGASLRKPQYKKFCTYHPFNHSFKPIQCSCNQSQASLWALAAVVSAGACVHMCSQSPLVGLRSCMSAGDPSKGEPKSDQGCLMRWRQGSGTVSDLVGGLDWVASNARRPAVASLSLGVPVGNWSRRAATAFSKTLCGFSVCKDDMCALGHIYCDMLDPLDADNVPIPSEQPLGAEMLSWLLLPSRHLW